MDRDELLALADRVEAAKADEQRHMLELAWQEIHGEYPGSHIGLSHQTLRFARMLNAEAYESAAMSLVPSDSWHEIKGPRKYLNIPTPSPNYWSVHLARWNHEFQVAGWGATPALALCAAAIRALAHQSTAAQAGEGE